MPKVEHARRPIGLAFFDDDDADVRMARRELRGRVDPSRKKAVERASASAAVGASTVTLAGPVAGSPVRGSMIWP